MRYGVKIMRKKYPSQIKYENENPTITFRVKIKEEDIQNMAHHTGKSISKTVRIALLSLEKDFTHTYNSYYESGKKEGIKIGDKEGDKKGYERGKNDWVSGFLVGNVILGMYCILNQTLLIIKRL